MIRITIHSVVGGFSCERASFNATHINDAWQQSQPICAQLIGEGVPSIMIKVAQVETNPDD